MGRLKKWQIIRSVNSNLIAYVDPLAPNFKLSSIANSQRTVTGFVEINFVDLC
jgi:hypothetical protein